MQRQNSSQEYCCLLIRENSNNNYYICFKYQKKLPNKPKIRWGKLLKIAAPIIITLLTSFTPVNQETLNSQRQTIQIIKNSVTITRLILEFYGK